MPALAEIEVWRDSSALLLLSHDPNNSEANYRLRFADQAIIDLLLDRRQILPTPTNSLVPQSTLDHFLCDQVFPRILAHDGILVLHAGAIRNAANAIVFLGESGRGKSTLVASLNQAGFSLLGDDALTVSWQETLPCVEAVYPSLRLLPDSLKALFVESPDVAPVAHYTSKQHITVPITHDDNSDPLPITALFSLAKPSPDGEIHLRPMSPAETCMALITNSFALDPTDKALSRKKLEDASNLANAVPAFEISYPRDYARLPEVHAAILRQVAEAGLAKN